MVLTFGITYAIGTPSVDNSDRREYVYCPISPLSLNTATDYNIEGCPTVRIYVYHWNTLTPIQQTSIDSQLRSSGFKDPDELGITNSIVNNTHIAVISK